MTGPVLAPASAPTPRGVALLWLIALCLAGCPGKGKSNAAQPSPSASGSAQPAPISTVVVDHGELVGLDLGVHREEVGHENLF